MPVRMEQVTHTYAGRPLEATAIFNVNLEIHDGEFVGLIGILIRQIHFGPAYERLIETYPGTVIINDIKIEKGSKDLKTVRQQVGLVFQYPEHQLFEETVKRILPLGPETWACPRRKSMIGKRSAAACGFAL